MHHYETIMAYKKFKYNVVQLIESVRERPCLWDKTLETYKDRVERRSAWEEIFCILEENYEELTPEEKRIIGEQILTKWTNIRDTFIKSLKMKMGRPKKKYLYHESLKFLLDEEYNTDVYTETEEPATDYFKQEPEIESPPPTTRKRHKKSTLNYDEDYAPIPKKVGNCSKKADFDENSYNDVDFVECDEMDASKINDPRIMNEDEAFFASLLPTVVKYNEDERLEFRIQVLAVMKNIKQNRSWNDA